MSKQLFGIGKKGTKLLMSLTPDKDGQEYGSGIYFGRDLTAEEKSEVQEYLIGKASEWLKSKAKFIEKKREEK